MHEPVRGRVPGFLKQLGEIPLARFTAPAVQGDTEGDDPHLGRHTGDRLGVLTVLGNVVALTLITHVMPGESVPPQLIATVFAL